MTTTATVIFLPQHNAISSMNQDRLDAAHALLGVSPATVAGIHSMMPMPDFMAKLQSSNGPSGLDALAALATASMSTSVIAAGCYSSSSEDEFEVMPPPPPRRRLRAASNPEGMEKWDSLSHYRRQHFVLPQSILEEELAEVKANMELMEEGRNTPHSRFDEKTEMSQQDLLNRARSRLLEDLSDASLNNEKGVLTLPHALSKYKEVG